MRSQTSEKKSPTIQSFGASMRIGMNLVMITVQANRLLSKGYSKVNFSLVMPPKIEKKQ